jgi:hypothetical protein
MKWTRILLPAAFFSALAVAQAPQRFGLARIQQLDANQIQVFQSGVQARVALLDTGSAVTGLVVSGRAMGLTPGQTYISRLYDTGSTADGANACLPTSGAVTPTQMEAGTWQVNPDGTGTLFSVKTGASYVSLSMVGAMSVRHVVGADAVLQACGFVQSDAITF